MSIPCTEDIVGFVSFVAVGVKQPVSISDPYLGNRPQETETVDDKILGIFDRIAKVSNEMQTSIALQ